MVIGTGGRSSPGDEAAVCRPDLGGRPHCACRISRGAESMAGEPAVVDRLKAGG